MKLVPIACLAIIVVATGCNTMVSRTVPIAEGTQYLGHDAKGLVMNVKTSIYWIYTAEPAYEEMAQLPRGKYKAYAMDRTFIYFKAPGTVSYSMKTGPRLSDREKKRGPGGIYVRRRGRSKMFPNVGAWIGQQGRAERVLAGYESFLDKQGKSWELIKGDGN